ncbi:MAG TPA: hypothetical protein VHF22_09765, partial [Planctomycetota bacterium]|nr:hypothetical protein [Planctomycetota bacterium]
MVRTVVGYEHPRHHEPHGSQAQRPASIPQAGNEVVARVVDAATGHAIGHARYELRGPGGERIAEGETDWQGLLRRDVAEAGRY